MTARKRLIGAAVVALLAAVSIGVADPRGFGWRSSGGWAADGNYGRMYDPKAAVRARR